MKECLKMVKSWFETEEVAAALVKETTPSKEMSAHRENTDPNEINIIIVSDNHMETEGLKNVLAYHDGDADYFLHCGDSNLDHDHEVMQPFMTVKGNTDSIQRYCDDQRVVLPNGDLIWITHGHYYRVGDGVDGLLQRANKFSSCPSIILYGHTHRVDARMVDGFLMINPGSIFLPRDGIKRTYAKLVVTPEFYDVTILNVKDHSMIKEFQFPR